MMTLEVSPVSSSNISFFGLPVRLLFASNKVTEVTSLIGIPITKFHTSQAQSNIYEYPNLDGGIFLTSTLI